MKCNITSKKTHLVPETGIDLPDVMDEGTLVAVDSQHFYVATGNNRFLGVTYVKKYKREEYIVTEKHF